MQRFKFKQALGLASSLLFLSACQTYHPKQPLSPLEEHCHNTARTLANAARMPQGTANVVYAQALKDYKNHDCKAVLSHTK
jgi:hypothetical protein